MNQSTRNFIRALERGTGVSVVVLLMAGICATVLLALYVHTLNLSIDRGLALRAQQQAALRMPAARAPSQSADANAGVRISSAR